MMNCPPDPSQHLIPVQGFGFFSPCALEKIQTRFQVYFYGSKMDTTNGRRKYQIMLLYGQYYHPFPLKFKEIS